MAGRLLLMPALLFYCAASATAQTSSRDQSNELAVSRKLASESSTTSTQILDRRISVDLRDVSIATALQHINDAADLGLRMSATNTAQLAPHVSLQSRDISARDALTIVLNGTGLRVVAPPNGPPALVTDSEQRQPEHRDVRGGAIVGVATDIETGERLASVLISVIGSSTRTLTSTDGRYKISLLPLGKYSLSARRLGYLPLTKVVIVSDTQPVIADFHLSKSQATLDEVVTTATGDQRLVEMGNAIGTFGVDSIVSNASIMTLSDVLTSRVSGVQVFEQGGFLGVSPQINIRGQNSDQLSNQPLLYVDGIRIANTEADVGETGRFNDLAPEEIESIEIVKGASAASLYGTDAANGVILVTTKHATGGRLRWTAYGNQGTLDADASRIPDSYHAWGHTTDGTNTPIDCTLASLGLKTCVQDSITHFNPLTNSATTPYGDGSITNYGLQVSGGSQARYFLSGGYTDNIGYLKMPATDLRILEQLRGAAGVGSDERHPNSVNKDSFRANITAPLGANADITVSSSLLFQNDHIPNPYSLNFGVSGPGYRDANDGWGAGIRPVEFFTTVQGEAVEHLTGGATANWRPLTWFSARGTAGADYSNNDITQMTRVGEGILFSNPGTRIEGKIGTTLYTFTGVATASFDLSSSLRSSTAIGANYDRTLAQSNQVQGTGLPQGCLVVNCAASVYGSEVTNEQIVAGAYLEQTISVDNRLYLKGGFRDDASSTFGTNVGGALYPKASVSWLASDEPFLSRMHWLTSLRFRAAYGEAGTEPDPLAAIAVEQAAPVSVGGVRTIGSLLGSLGNTHIRPERQRELEGGVDLELFSHRLQLSGTYYTKKSADALAYVAEPTSIGGVSTQANVGSVDNWGYEGLLDARIVESKPIKWDVAVNASVNHNRFIKGAPGFTSYLNAGSPGDSIGFPLDSYFGIPYTYQANHNGILEPSAITQGTEQRYIGTSYPQIQLTGSQTLQLFDGHVALRAQIDYRGQFFEADQDHLNQCLVSVCRALIVPGTPLSAQAAALAYSQTFNPIGFISNATFARLREVSIAFNFPDIVAHALRARSISATLAGRNLALWTKFTGSDPESAGAAGHQQIDGAYIDAIGLGPARSLALRLNVGF
jgi:TonB-linked SusC/RagA family outer membrane protein